MLPYRCCVWWAFSQLNAYTHHTRTHCRCNWSGMPEELASHRRTKMVSHSAYWQRDEYYVSRFDAPLNNFYCALLATLFITFTEKWYTWFGNVCDVCVSVWLNRNTTTIARAAAAKWHSKYMGRNWESSSEKENERENIRAAVKCEVEPFTAITIFIRFIVSSYRVCATINFHWIFIQWETIFPWFVGTPCLLCLENKTVK